MKQLQNLRQKEALKKDNFHVNKFCFSILGHLSAIRIKGWFAFHISSSHHLKSS